MHGDDGEKGSGTFHNTALVGPIFTGGLASAATPEQFGPRKVGQTGVAPRTKPAAATRMEQHKAMVFMLKGVSCGGR
jgi:hypothetical protein